MERFSTLSSFMQLVSGRDRTQTQAVQLQNHPPSPLPPAQCSPPHSALVHTELWILPAHGMLTPTLLSPSSPGRKRREVAQVKGTATSLLPLCRPHGPTGRGRSMPPPAKSHSFSSLKRLLPSSKDPTHRFLEKPCQSALFVD